MLSLRPMREDEFDGYFEQLVEGTSQELVETYQIAVDQAREMTRTRLKHRLAARLETGDNYFFVAERSAESGAGAPAGGAPEPLIVGHLWVSINTEEGFAWLDDIEVVEGWRGHGYGGEMLALLVEELSKHNIRSMSLHVAAFNERAIRLYQKSGFHFTGHDMKKDW